jgi:WD40 repeat protein
MAEIGAVIASFVTVTLFTAVVGAWGWLLDGHSFYDAAHITIVQCVPYGRHQIATVHWVGPLNRAVRPHQVGLHDADDEQEIVRVAWPSIHPRRIAQSPIDETRLFLGDMRGAIYAVSLSEPVASPFMIGRHAEGDMHGIKCSPNGEYLVSFGSESLYVWNVELAELHWQRSDLGPVDCCVVDPDSRRLVCGLARGGRLVEIDLQTGKIHRDIAAERWMLAEVAFSPDGRRLAVVQANGKTQLLAWPEATIIWERESYPRYAAATGMALFSPCGRYLITPGRRDPRKIAISSAATGAWVADLEGHERPVFGATFSRDGRLFSWGCDGTIRIWDLPTRSALNVISLVFPGSA